MSAFTSKLNSYWLWLEIREKLNLSNPSYKYWHSTINIKLNNKYIFLKKNTLPKKYQFIESSLTDLSGYLPIRYAAHHLHVNEHVFSYEKMKLYNKFEYIYVQNIKFVNIRKFLKEFNIQVDKDSLLHLGRMKDLEITTNSEFYNLNDDYGLVVYN